MISEKLIHGCDDDYRYHDLPAQCSHAHTAGDCCVFIERWKSDDKVQGHRDCWKDLNDNVARMMTIDTTCLH